MVGRKCAVVLLSAWLSVTLASSDSAAQKTGRVYCPDGSSHVQQRSDTRDPCAASPSRPGRAAYTGPNIVWGGMTKRAWKLIVKDCRNKPLCFLVQSAVAMPLALAVDAPVYAVKGVGLGLYHGGKGLVYAGKGVGRAVAYPFNRPKRAKRPKPPKAAPKWAGPKRPKPAKLAKLGERNKPRHTFDEPESIDTAPIILDDRSPFRKSVDDKLAWAKASFKNAADLAGTIDTHREGLALSGELVGSAKILDQRAGQVFRGVAVLDAGVTASEGNTAGAAGKVLSLGIGMIAQGPAYAGALIAGTAKNAAIGTATGVYLSQGLTPDQAHAKAVKDYEDAHKNEKSAETRFFWGLAGL